MSFGVATARGKVVQIVSTQTSALATGTTIMPVDNTIPQITEGDQYMTRTITPKNAANILFVEVIWFGACSIANNFSIALFVGTTTDALAAMGDITSGNNYVGACSLNHSVDAGVTTELTFQVRCGPASASTMTFNGNSGNRRFGAIPKSSITITEFTP